MSPSRSRQARRAEARRVEAKRAQARRRGQRASRAPRSGASGFDLGFVRKIPRAASLAGAAIAIVVVVVVVLSSGGSSSPPESRLLTGSGYPNANTSNTRYVGGSIDASNVAKLSVAWTLPLTAKREYGSYSSAPVIAGGVVYSQDLESNVEAIDLRTGKLIWTKTYDSSDQGPNGLVVEGGRVYGTTTSSAFALDEKSGRQLWSVPLVRNEHEGIDMAPGYHHGVVYVSTVPGSTTQL